MPFEGPLPASTSPATSGRCASSRKRSETLRGAQERAAAAAGRRPTAASWPPSTRTAATATPPRPTRRPPGLRAALEQALRLGARDRSRRACSTRARCRAPPPRARSTRLRSTRPVCRAREWFELLAAESRAAAIDPRIVDWEMAVEVAHGDAPAGHERRRRRRRSATASCSPAHRRRRMRTAITQTRTLGGTAQHLPAGRRRGARALRLRRRRAARRRGGARARAGAELPERARWTCCSRPTR